MHKSAAWFAFLLSLSGALLRGQTWTVGRAGIPGATAANSVAFGNGRFVVALDSPSGQPHVVWSADGLSWSGAADAVSGYSVAFAGDAFFLAGSDGIWRSSDGATWSRVYQGRTV